MTTQNKVKTEQPTKLDGVVIGLLVGLDEKQQPLVVFPANTQETAIPARATTLLVPDDVGKEIALLFENGDPSLPLVIGRLQKPQTLETVLKPLVKVQMDEQHLVLSAQESITLKCGKASITLTKAGKVLLRGTYLLSRSSGVNRIKGGSVQLN